MITLEPKTCPHKLLARSLAEGNNNMKMISQESYERRDDSKLTLANSRLNEAADEEGASAYE